MAPLPKRKRSKSKQGMRQGHSRIGLVQKISCPRCRSTKLPHRVCTSCGYYNGRDVLHIGARTEDGQTP